MSINNYFKISEETRTRSIENDILLDIPQRNIRRKVKDIVENYEGHDGDALIVLSYAVEHDRFYEFLRKLEQHHKEVLKFVPLGSRNSENGNKTSSFFQKCYEELGIKIEPMN